MALNPYVTFNGNCREAFDFYRSVFGGEFALVSTFRDGPEDMGIPPEDLDLLMHISLPIGSGVLMGSDSSPAFGPDPVVGTNVALSFDARDKHMQMKFLQDCQQVGKSRCRWETCSGVPISVQLWINTVPIGKSQLDINQT